MSRRKRRRKPESCYMCSAVATSREHVPPKCFFPTKDEIPGEIDLRKNLITVPSCDEHNSEKSGDDQFIFSIISSHIETNPIAQRIFSLRVMRSLRRKRHLIPGFFKGLMPVFLGNVQTGMFYIDRPRFDESIDHMARGVYFHHFNEKIGKKSHILSYSMQDISSNRRDEINWALWNWRNFSENAFSNHPKNGENPAVFYYQVIEDSEKDRFVIRLVFYGGVVVDVLFGELEKFGGA